MVHGRPPVTSARRLIPLLAIVALIWFGMFIRVWDLNRESFWSDEGWTMLLSKGPTLQDVVITMANDQHPPLYFALLHYWIDLAGNSEFTVRLLSTFASVLGIALVYRLGRDLFRPGVALAAALLLALQDNDIMLAREARHYSLLVMFGIAATLFYFRYLKHGKRADGIGWLLAAIAMMYTHYLGGFILIVQLVHALIFVRPWRKLVDVIIRWGLACAAWIPWAVVFINQASVRYQRPIIFQSALKNSPETFSLVRGDLIGYQYGLTGGLLLLGLVYILYREGRIQLTWRPRQPIVFAALWLVVPTLVIVAINTRFEILTTRNFLIVVPAIMLLMGNGIMNLDRLARWFVILILLFVSLTTVDAYELKPPWRTVAAELVRYRSADEPVVMDVWTQDMALRYHIGRDLGADPATLPLISMPEWREQYGEGYFLKLLNTIEDKPALWVVRLGEDRDNLLGFFTQHGFTLTATQVAYHREVPITTYRFDRVPAIDLADYAGVLALSWADVTPINGATDGTIRVRLLWKALTPPPVDYSISVVALSATDGRVLAGADSPPFGGNAFTSRWQVGQAYFDDHTLTLPAGTTLADIRIGVKVYWYGDQVPLPVKGSSTPDYFVLPSR